MTRAGTETRDPSWLAREEAYEKRLGVYADSHPVVDSALTSAIGRMDEVIRAAYDADGLDATDERDLDAEVFTKDDAGRSAPRSSGPKLRTLSRSPPNARSSSARPRERGGDICVVVAPEDEIADCQPAPDCRQSHRAEAARRAVSRRVGAVRRQAASARPRFDSPDEVT